MSPEKQKPNETRCPNCGRFNPSWRSQCEECRTSLPKPNTQSKPTIIQCSSCGYNNPSWRSDCANCQAKLIPVEVPDRIYAYAGDRPGCVSAYAVLLGIAGGLLALNGIITTLQAGGSAIGIFLISAVFSVLYFLFARGLWRMRNWARVTVIIVQSIGFLLNLITMFTPPNPVYVVGSLLGLILCAYIIYWFSSRGDLFS